MARSLLMVIGMCELLAVPASVGLPMPASGETHEDTPAHLAQRE